MSQGVFALAVNSSRQTVGATAVKVNTSDTSGVSGSSVCIKNMSTIRVYVGGSDVTAANGYPIPANGEIAVDFESSSEAFYVVSPDGAAEIAVLQSGL